MSTHNPNEIVNKTTEIRLLEKHVRKLLTYPQRILGGTRWGDLAPILLKKQKKYFELDPRTQLNSPSNWWNFELTVFELTVPDLYCQCHWAIFFFFSVYSSNLPISQQFIFFGGEGGVAFLGQQTLVEYTQGVSNETNEDVRMYIEEFILVDVVTLLYKLELSMELNMHWKCCSLYTIATMEEKCENCS